MYFTTNVSLKELIDSGMIKPGTQIFGDEGVEGIINIDGSLTVDINGTPKIFPFLSGAARRIEGRSLNGWLYWKTIENGQLVTLKSIRDKFNPKS